MARKAFSRRRAGHVDAGAAWISYSDMMAALLLVFVLVLSYSVYQYFVMLETKTAELTAQETQLNAQRTQLATQQSTLDEQQSQLLSKQNELTSALTAIENQKGLLNTQTQTLTEQEATIAAAQASLQEKESALAAAQSAMADQQIKLDAATALVQTQQSALDTQQQKLDDLVGVRTKIIRDLSDALSKANLKASVDKNTGDIMLESSVFFDVGKFDIKETGQKLLNQFVPLYLSVLLSDQYVDYLGEIVIEGHTDTQGTYLSNLELSQQRALTVATYCLQMQGLSQAQQDKLRQVLTAKGRSYSDPVYNSDGSVNMDASRRVEFKFRLKDSEMIDEMRAILGAGNP
ncbi:MAG: OmpA family protein [Candidatus Limiplasma sp.]|nr:OmpA family protein [Candidatus Limiplasma sp.]